MMARAQRQKAAAMNGIRKKNQQIGNSAQHLAWQECESFRGNPLERSNEPIRSLRLEGQHNSIWQKISGSQVRAPGRRLLWQRPDHPPATRKDKTRHDQTATIATQLESRLNSNP
jgi:hypothetical protein